MPGVLVRRLDIDAWRFQMMRWLLYGQQRRVLPSNQRCRPVAWVGRLEVVGTCYYLSVVESPGGVVVISSRPSLTALPFTSRRFTSQAR